MCVCVCVTCSCVFMLGEGDCVCIWMLEIDIRYLLQPYTPSLLFINLSNYAFILERDVLVSISVVMIKQ